MKAKCLDCRGEVEVKKGAIIGDLLECPNCGTEMEIVSKKPLKLRIIEEEK